MAQDLTKRSIKQLSDLVEFSECIPHQPNPFLPYSNSDSKNPRWKVKRTMEETNFRPGFIWVDGVDVDDAILSAQISDFRVFRAALGEVTASEIILKTKYEIEKSWK